METKRVILLNASNEILTHVSWQRAICLLVAGRAHVVRAHENKVVRSQHCTFPHPHVIRLEQYKFVKWYDKPASHKVPTKKTILVRDNHTCIYCGHKATTIDHIRPRSRGGENTWKNLAACCHTCNHKKANHMPHEIGFTLLWEPEEDTPAKRRARIAEMLDLPA